MINKRGSFTIEATFGILLVMIVIMAVTNLIAISFERNILSQKVEAFATQTSINGGVTNAELAAFLQELSYLEYDIDNVSVSAKRVVNGEESGNNIILSDMSSTNFISVTDASNQIHLKIIIPYKDKTIFYSLFNELEEMTFERRFISRRV